MSDKVVICLEKGGQRDMAEAFARRTGYRIAEKQGEYLTVLFSAKGVSLTGFGLTYQGDFENMLHRVTNGRLQHEMLVRAAKSEKPGRKAIDATAGMGEDAFLLAAQGYEVTLYEQNPVIAALLKDALRRAKKHMVLKDIAARMKLIEGNSVECLAKQLDSVDVIYLDPMFPARQKSAAVKKKFQLLHVLEKPCDEAEEDALIRAAFAAGSRKVVIKRPVKGGHLAGIKPSYSITGKAVRYDVLVPPSTKLQ